MTRWIAILALCLTACGSSEEASSDQAIVVDTSEGGEEEPSDATAEEGPEEPADASREAGRLVVGEDACTTDADCVPAGCCHPAACVAQANAPACDDVACTMNCQAGTMDCGGGCLCHEGRCAARIDAQPEPRVAD